MVTNILLAVDGSTASLQAAREGIALARALKARVTALVVTLPWATYFSRELAVVVPDVVVPQAEYDRKRNASAACILQEVEMDARNAGVGITSIHRINRDPHRAIVDVTRHEGCDLIVMASHCHHGFTGSLLGSETMAVLTDTDVPVLIYRRIS